MSDQACQTVGLFLAGRETNYSCEMPMSKGLFFHRLEKDAWISFKFEALR